ncbi:probable E3 ubiquitin-protein ligase makorin-2 [Ctenocephalides felis]|nr:probable E3 ubiquitin-protein ligase makorin-2 [Ctenocephalides felis]
MEKPEREKRFGILPNCNHSFCLTCIRKWRQARQFENKIIRACPECRVTSDFVCPSSVWVDATCGKDKLLTDYKQALSQKPCKHFKQGRAKCPFGNKCFYLHALPDGTKADVGPPVRRSRNREMDIDMVQRYVIWNYVREREQERLLRNSRLDYVSEMDNVDDDDWFTVY